MYVISVKRILDYDNIPIKEEDQYWEYASYDKYAGSFLTGYPCLTSICNQAEIFDSKEDAYKWFKRNKEHLISERKINRYDLSTLGIRKIILKNVLSLEI